TMSAQKPSTRVSSTSSKRMPSPASPSSTPSASLAPPAVGVAYGFEVGRLPVPAAYSPDGAVLAVGSDDGGVLLCDTATGLPVRTLQGHRSRVYAVRYDAASHQLVTGAADHHQPMCQVSHPIVGAGTGSGSLSAQSGRHPPPGPGRMVQHSAAGSQRKSAGSSRPRWYSASAQVRSNCQRSRPVTEAGIARSWHGPRPRSTG
ncbi:WD40 repeat domain-containing protein, partial [Micromonospora chalcea]